VCRLNAFGDIVLGGEVCHTNIEIFEKWVVFFGIGHSRRRDTCDEDFSATAPGMR
jgi:hypothetical protein